MKLNLLLSITLQDVFKLTSFMQFLNYVNSANKVSIDVELRVGRPLWVNLESFSDFIIWQNVKVSIVKTIVIFKEFNHSFAETTERWLWFSLHKEHNLILFNKLLQFLFQC